MLVILCHRKKIDILITKQNAYENDECTYKCRH